MKAVLIIAALLCGLSYGQDLASSVDDVAGNNTHFFDMQIGTVYKTVDIEGSPYMDEIYKTGVANVNGRDVRLLMRYDAFKDQIELKDRMQKSFNLQRREDLSATFGGKTYQAIPYVVHGDKKLGYANPLNEGNVVLYFKPKKTFIQAQKPENGYSDYVPPRYVEDNAYYIRKGNATAEKIRLAKGPVMRYMRDKGTAVKNYVKDNDLSLKSEREVVQLLNYYNSL